MKIQPVILSGGSGTRLWPLSREKYPKQLLMLFNQKSMLQETVTRLRQFKFNELKVSKKSIIVSNQEYRFLIAQQLKSMDLEYDILLEPFGRNTAPALTLAALKILNDDKDALMLVMPADHLIEQQEKFCNYLSLGVELALSGSIICFGIQPTRPDTGYGYIKTIGNHTENLKRVDHFVEKPNLDLAKQYLNSGEYVWNSGIFMLKASTWLKAICALNRKIYDSCVNSFEKSIHDKDFIWINESDFENCPDDSIDYAVMEKIGLNTHIGIESFVVPMAVGWSDVGSWDAVWDASIKDEEGNSTNDNEYSYFIGSQNNLVISDNRRVISLLGIDDAIVIDTHDALLIANKHKLSEMKNLLNLIKKDHPSLAQQGRKVFRPWGNYDSIDSGENFQVKKIIVNPGQSLSLQMHYHRAEHWIVVKGTGKITKGNEEFILHENQSVYIPLGTTHRLENPGKLPLELIEVQSGNYLEEDDIVRFDDIYGRIN